MYVATRKKTINLAVIFDTVLCLEFLQAQHFGNSICFFCIPDLGTRVYPSTDFNSANKFPQHACDEADPIAETMF
jgi:hypothetical protein